MAEEWWSSARTGGDHASTSPATAESGTISRLTNSMLSSMQPGAPFFLDDPHVADWTQPFMQGKAAEAEEQPTGLTFNALLQLQGDVSHQFLLDQAAAAPAALLPYPVSDGGAASQQGASSFYADSQQQFPSFFSSSGLFGAPAHGSPPPLLLQAQTPKPLKSGGTTEPAVQDACSSSATKRSSAAHTTPAAAKKPRTETPSSMPTFKVRKEKLGDRITALQQLVSPFGKTDTASVLHEAIGYIKFLHDQVASLSSPYFIKCTGSPLQLQHKQGSDYDKGEARDDMRSRGLCLIPVASTTYAVASETAPEFWHPTFGGTFR